MNLCETYQLNGSEMTDVSVGVRKRGMYTWWPLYWVTARSWVPNCWVRAFYFLLGHW